MSGEEQRKDTAIRRDCCTPTTSAERAFQEDVLQKRDALLQTSEQQSLQSDDVPKSNKESFQQGCALLLQAVEKRIGAKVQKLERKLSSLQKQNAQIILLMREITEANKECHLERGKAFRTQLVQVVWERVFLAEKYSGGTAEKIEFNKEGFGKLKKACRDFNNELKMMLAQDFGTVAFQDPNGLPLNNNRHHVVDWRPTNQLELHKTIVTTFRCGVRDIIDERIIYPQRVCAYYYQASTEQPD